MNLLLKSLYVILLQDLSLQHYIPPPHNCLLATICNHTGISMCGKQKDQKHNRIFLDECDMFEYNCDHHKVYLKTELSDCTTKETESAVISTISTIQMLPSLTTELINVSQNTVTDKQSTLTLHSEYKDPTTTPKISIKPSSIQSTTASVSITESTFVATTKSSVLTTTSISTVVIDSNCTRAKGNNTSNLKTDETTQNLTKPMTTILSTQSLTPDTSTKTDASWTPTTIISTLPNVTKIEPTVAITTGTTTTTIVIANTSLSSTVPSKITESIVVNNNTIEANGKDVSSSTQNICEYPDDCDRPRTWETTVKGETRDFFQILKARFGSRIKILRATTHFPQHVISTNNLPISFNEDNGSFHYGVHNEG